MKYCPYTFKTQRFKTREVMVGSVGVGGNNPVRIQSMTTSDTRNSEETAEQIMKLADFGCEIVRVTVQGMKEAHSCEKIKEILVQKGYNTPLVADIHFFPKAAMNVADFVDKVRINPGNYIDKRATFKVLEYTEQDYREELERLEEKFTPLVLKCKKNKVALRIGTNHGSLSDRIMNRFGDSPSGMVESALEFARVARANDFHDLIFSMKASNTHVMIQAYRLLVQKMIVFGWDYPLHLGVTEAGSGEDGRIKSAVGIGSLLLDGLGDTIRVSLTEDPWHEIDPCQRLIKLADQYAQRVPMLPFSEKTRNPLQYEKRDISLSNQSLHKDASVFLEVRESDILKDSFYDDIGLEDGKKNLKSADALVLVSNVSDKAEKKLSYLKQLGIDCLVENTRSFTRLAEGDSFDKLGDSKLILLGLQSDRVHYARKAFEHLKQKQIEAPVILDASYSLNKEDLCIALGAEMGALLCDGLGEGLMIRSDLPLKERRELSLNLLQACRLRSSKTEFISCPSCGRTLFDLQTVTQKIQNRTRHLPGVKIAVMGCIVNGPGEMADADFGYVGSKPGMIDLYIGKQCVERDIPDDEAVERLVQLLKKHNAWQEPKKLPSSELSITT